MAHRASSVLPPFAKPILFSPILLTRTLRTTIRWQSTGTKHDDGSAEQTPDLSNLNPPPEDYGRFIFQDKCTVAMHAGAGGHGCVSFLREKYIEEGGPNGGDGGSGGGIYIQAVEGLTSLHKLARRGTIRASRGRNGQGKSRGGKRGDDVLIQVPIGTVVREVDRYDPVADAIVMRRQARRQAEERKRAKKEEEGEEEEEEDDDDFVPINYDRWVLYPGSNPSDFLTVTFPDLKPRRQAIAAMEPQKPIYLDFTRPMDKPMLLAAGGAGGFGNGHFATRAMGRPKFASRGEGAIRLELDFELKLLADVGLVGKPNAGKSTLLRSLTNSRTRIGNWEFTTLSPHIGTVIVDDNTGRPVIESKGRIPRTRFTIADIPGLVEDAHLDRGLGLGFLRHIDRAGILAFVIDLSAGDPVHELKKLWHELGAYERQRDTEPEPTSTRKGVIDWNSSSTGGLEQLQDESRHQSLNKPPRALPFLNTPLIHTKPWFVVATKADLENTQDQYKALQEYLSAVQAGTVEHPSGHSNGWKTEVSAVPISAIRGEGVSRIRSLVMHLLDCY
ncbi:GTPase Obg [Penicillium taxi]|uniref:GTPase Obg n=1 Tax=Penicillium taxi TaxID=168475 RepID=UPI002544ED98|nr:GTPase Obg [Penicillium taxi]KAJ5902613.1 GTPase Obg [Penicillium taxi]